MTEKEYILFVELLEKFIDDCGLDNVEECHLASLLLDKINDK